MIKNLPLAFIFVLGLILHLNPLQAKQLGIVDIEKIKILGEPTAGEAKLELSVYMPAWVEGYKIIALPRYYDPSHPDGEKSASWTTKQPNSSFKIVLFLLAYGDASTSEEPFELIKIPATVKTAYKEHSFNGKLEAAADSHPYIGILNPTSIELQKQSAEDPNAVAVRVRFDQPLHASLIHSEMIKVPTREPSDSYTFLVGVLADIEGYDFGKRGSGSVERSVDFKVAKKDIDSLNFLGFRNSPNTCSSHLSEFRHEGKSGE